MLSVDLAADFKIILLLDLTAALNVLSCAKVPILNIACWTASHGNFAEPHNMLSVATLVTLNVQYFNAVCQLKFIMRQFSLFSQTVNVSCCRQN